jgi:hypothetical protein
MSQKDDPGVGPVRRALFQDVPVILDSLWRRWEFNINRVGLVGLADPHEFALRRGWMNSAFILYVFVGAFAVLGPTLDALCSTDSPGYAKHFRTTLGTLLLIASISGAGYVLNESLERIRRRADKRADSSCDRNPHFVHRAERRQRRNAVLDKLMPMARGAGDGIVGHLVASYFGNVARIATATPLLTRHERWALLLAIGVLAVGSTVLFLPFGYLGNDFRANPLDIESCTLEANRSYVFAQAGALLALVGGGFAIWHRWGASSANRVFLGSAAWLAVIVGALWAFATPTFPSEGDGGFYPHVYLVVVGLLLVTACAARWLARGMFAKFRRRHGAKFRRAMRHQDLLRYEFDPPDVSKVRLWSALINGLERHTLHFLLLPAFVVFLAPQSTPSWYVLVFAVISAGLVMYSSLSRRWAQVLIYVDRWFLVGTPLVVSIAVIAIALARFFGVQYVATVLDAAPMGVLAIIVLMCYAAVWYFEFWVNRWLAEEMLGIVGDSREMHKGFLVCPSFQPESWARADGRYLSCHGTGRLCAQGWFTRDVPDHGELKDDHAFTTYGFAELIELLSARVPDGTELARDVERRLALYYNLVNGFLIVAFAAAWLALTPETEDVKPMIHVKAIKAEVASPETAQYQGPVEAAAAAAPADPLAARLVAGEGEGEPRPALVVAASGGGTRAAVYTAVALEGMAKLQRTRDIVLLSGVSGGGASSAMFASRYEALARSDPAPGDGNAWARYVEAAGKPYIEDVLEGIGELRILREQSLGVLLEESFRRRAFNGDAPIRNLGQLGEGPALILNSAISGHPYDDSQMLFERIAPPQGPRSGECVQRSRPYANLAGGRLIFTNLRNLSGFPKRSEDAPDMLLPYRIVNDDTVTLAAASALTANFPPVFSNAHVKLDAVDDADPCPRSYYVTDGGATENLGLVSALYALRGTLQSLAPDAKVAPIHVLALEASAIDYDYRDDRGIGAATGGSKERINAGLTQMLLTEVRGLACARGGELRVHYLPLPVAFRSRGGFGTHWMFAPNIRVSNPHLARQEDEPFWKRSGYKDFADLDRGETMRTLRAMFDTADPMCVRAERIEVERAAAREAGKRLPLTDGWTADVQRVARWICGKDDQRGTEAAHPDVQVDAWARVMMELGANPTRLATPDQSCP